MWYKSIKILEENVCINLYNPEVGNSFLDIMWKTQVTKEEKSRLVVLLEYLKLLFWNTYLVEHKSSSNCSLEPHIGHK